jgi:(p)ppGpp synthase/HD superfamily hydrolase
MPDGYKRLGSHALTEQFDNALSFAAELHRQQPRKGTKIPYMGHLLAVAALVIEDGGSEDEAIAALLHDSVEDQGDHYSGGRKALRIKIRDEYGPEVAAIVDACTDDDELAKGLAATPDDERKLWLERKRKYVESIAHKTPRALRVTTADKVHNAESILDSHGAHGPEVWTRFRTKSRQDQVDVYRSLYAAITARNEEFPANEKSHLPKRLLRAVDLMELLS